MDEPTNHLDIQSKEIIKLALQKYEGTLIVISHDREFLQGLADKIFEFRNGEMKEFLGNIDEYLEYRQKESIREISMEKAKLDSKKTNTLEQKISTQPIVEKENKKNFVSKEQKNILNKIQKIEDKITTLEQEIKNFENDFSKNNPTEEALNLYKAKQTELETIMEEWENLNTSIN